MDKKFRKFWVMTVNNCICDASYSGKELKEKNPIPSFRKFWFIRSVDDLKYFTPQKNITNIDLVESILHDKKQNKPPA